MSCHRPFVSVTVNCDHNLSHCPVTVLLLNRATKLHVHRDTVPPGPNKHQSAVTCLQFNTKFVVTSSDDGTVKLWDVKTGQSVNNISLIYYLDDPKFDLLDHLQHSECLPR